MNGPIVHFISKKVNNKLCESQTGDIKISQQDSLDDLKCDCKSYFSTVIVLPLLINFTILHILTDLHFLQSGADVYICALLKASHGVEGTPWLRVTHQRQNIKVKHSIKATAHQDAQSGPYPCRDVPEMMVTGPHMSPSFCRAKFLIRHRIRVLLPTLGGPTTTITIGGGSRGVRSTRGIWCFFIFMSWDLKEKKVHGKSIWAVLKLTTSPVIPTFD